MNSMFIFHDGQQLAERKIIMIRGKSATNHVGANLLADISILVATSNEFGQTSICDLDTLKEKTEEAVAAFRKRSNYWESGGVLEFDHEPFSGEFTVRDWRGIIVTVKSIKIEDEQFITKNAK